MDKKTIEELTIKMEQMSLSVQGELGRKIDKLATRIQKLEDRLKAYEVIVDTINKRT